MLGEKKTFSFIWLGFCSSKWICSMEYRISNIKLALSTQLKIKSLKNNNWKVIWSTFHMIFQIGEHCKSAEKVTTDQLLFWVVKLSSCGKIPLLILVYLKLAHWIVKMGSNPVNLFSSKIKFHWRYWSNIVMILIWQTLDSVLKAHVMSLQELNPSRIILLHSFLWNWSYKCNCRHNIPK